MPEPFEPLRETLLRAGVAPAQVRRYMLELSDHFSDLVGEELAGGKTHAEAEAGAYTRLGADEALADAMLAERSLQSWTGRAPWMTLLVGPIALLVLAWLIPLRGFALLLRHLDVNPPAQPAWLPDAADAVFGFIQVAAPVLIVAMVALLGDRQRSRLAWPVLGCLTVAYVGGGLVWGAHWPAAGTRGFFTITFRWANSLAVGSLSLALAAVIYRKSLGRGLAGA
jgi:hypothetical protein